MKKSGLFLWGFLLLVGGTVGAENVKTVKQEVPVLNVEKKLSQKKVTVQSLGKVRYIRFSAPADVLLGDYMTLFPDKNSLFFCGRQNGDVVGFDREGNFLGKFNHQGQGANEYGTISQLVYDEANKEVCLVVQGTTSKLFVFDMKGECKRVLPLSAALKPWKITSFNPDLWLLFDIENTFVIRNGEVQKLVDGTPGPTLQPFILIDKRTGKEAGRLPVTIPNRFRPFVLTRHQGLPWVFIAQINNVIQYGDNQILNDPASDVCYQAFPDCTVKPLLTRTPAVATMKEKTIVSVQAASSRYMLIKQVILKAFEDEDNLREQLILYSADDNSFVACELSNADYKGKSDLFTKFYTAGNKIYFVLYPNALLEALDQHKLSGDLHRIAMELDEEDNLILMEVTLDD